MELKDRITFNGAELTQVLEAELDKLSTYRYDSKYRTLLGNRLIEKLNRWDSDIRKQKDIPLTIVVCGEFKRGKSSIINALLGEDVVTTNVTTETITLNRISYGAHENLLILRDGRQLRLSDEELTCEKLRGILGELGERPARLELKRPVAILKDINIIDTPGLGDAMEDFTDDVADALRIADAVVYVFSVAYPLSVQEQLFIRTAILPQRYTDLFLLGNFTDLLESADDCERIKDTIRRRIADILPGHEPLLISSLDERNRQLDAAVPNEELGKYVSGNFEMFRSALSSLLSDKRESVIPDRIERLITSLITDVSCDLNAIAQGLDMSVSDAQMKADELSAKNDKLIAEQEKAMNRIDTITGACRADSIRWLEEFIGRMQKDADSLTDMNGEDIKRYYALFCIDKIHEAITRCNDRFMLSISNELDSIDAELAKDLSLGSYMKTPSLRITMQNKTWTSVDTFSYYSDFFGLSALPFVSPVTGFIAGTARHNKIQNSAPALVKEIQAQYPEIRLSAISGLSKAYSDLSERAKKQVTEYFAQQFSELSELLDETAASARRDEESKQQIRIAVGEINSVLSSIKERFSALGDSAAAV